MVVITTGRTSDIEYDLKALFSEWAIHRFLYKGRIIFSVCVCVGGGGGVNFEGGQKKSRFDKGGNKVWPKYGKGGKELRIRQGGNTFFDNLNV